MNEGSLQKEVILNGTNSIQVFEENGLIYRVEPFAIVQEISIYAFTKDKTKIVRLDDRLTRDYEIIGVTADIPEDDKDAKARENNPGYQPSVDIGVRIFHISKAIENIQLRLTSYPFYVNKLTER